MKKPMKMSTKTSSMKLSIYCRGSKLRTRNTTSFMIMAAVNSVHDTMLSLVLEIEPQKLHQDLDPSVELEE